MRSFLLGSVNEGFERRILKMTESFSRRGFFAEKRVHTGLAECHIYYYRIGAPVCLQECFCFVAIMLNICYFIIKQIPKLI